MKLHHLAGFSVGVALILSNSQSSLAFSINPSTPGATFRYRSEAEYSFRLSKWKTKVNNDLWYQPLPKGGTFQFINTLKLLWATRATPPFGQGWDFQAADRDLEGSFEIASYYACAYNQPCGGDTGVGPTFDLETTGVGAVFGLKYHPLGSDPTPINSNLHWIQVVQSSKTFLPLVDNGNNFNDPYYDTNSRYAGKDFFTDKPYFYAPADPGTPHFFSAELYLVEEIGQSGNTPRKVKIYNGIRWGWNNELIPPDPCNGSSGGGGCPTVASANRIASRELPLSDFDSGDPNQSSERVPEPTTILGLLALGAAGTIQMLKNKFTKQQ